MVHVQLATQYFHGTDPFLSQLACDYTATDVAITQVPRNLDVKAAELPVPCRPAPNIGRDMMSTRYHIDVMQSGIVVVHTKGVSVLRIDDFPENSGATAIFLTFDNVELMGVAVNESANVGPKHLAIGGVPPGTIDHGCT